MPRLPLRIRRPRVVNPFPAGAPLDEGIADGETHQACAKPHDPFCEVLEWYASVGVVGVGLLM